MSMSASRPASGSSSTTIAIFCIASRNRLGIDASASATRRSNSDFFTDRFPGQLRAFARDDGPKIVALVADGALVAERFGSADPPAVEDQRVGRSRPPLGRQRGAQLLLD